MSGDSVSLIARSIRSAATCWRQNKHLATDWRRHSLHETAMRHMRSTRPDLEARNRAKTRHSSVETEPYRTETWETMSQGVSTPRQDPRLQTPSLDRTIAWTFCRQETQRMLRQRGMRAVGRDIDSRIRRVPNAISGTSGSRRRPRWWPFDSPNGVGRESGSVDSRAW